MLPSLIPLIGLFNRSSSSMKTRALVGLGSMIVEYFCPAGGMELTIETLRVVG